MKLKNIKNIYEIMKEFYKSYKTLNKNTGKSICIFGSARLPENDIYYKKGLELSSLLTENGYNIITGGGPGIMEAFNKGCAINNGNSIGININLPLETHNKYININRSSNHNYFFIRKQMYIEYSKAFIVFPGGYGTLDELFEILCLIQTKKMEKVPIFLVGIEYWTDLVKWLNSCSENSKTINKEDLNLFILTDNYHDILKKLKNE